MEIITILLIALGLSFDTFAASISLGIVKSKIKFLQAIPVAFLFAIFQGGLTIGGYFSGAFISHWVEAVDHWIALALLAFIGGRMIWNSFQEEKDKIIDYDNPRTLLSLAVGTSIDAFAVGISLGLIHTSIWWSGFIISSVTFLTSMVAMKIGKGIGKKFGDIAELIGGIVLIAIGIKIVIEHIFLQ